MVDVCPRPLALFWRRPSVEENAENPEIASLCPESCVLILHPLEASHSLTTPSSLTLKNEKSSLPIARANLTDPQFTDEFTPSTWFIVAMGERLVLSDCALSLPAFVSDDGSSLVPDRTRKSHVARLPSAPALTINGSDRFPRSRSETGER
jgi:hypothetical protein